MLVKGNFTTEGLFHVIATMLFCRVHCCLHRCLTGDVWDFVI